jgi:hypothetical protein
MKPFLRWNPVTREDRIKVARARNVHGGIPLSPVLICDEPPGSVASMSAKCGVHAIIAGPRGVVYGPDLCT